METLEGLEDPAGSSSITGGYGAGVTEAETRKAIQEIEAERPLTGMLRTVKQLAISLSISIDRGNNKGRAVANEAGQLFAMMQQLAPAADDGANADDSHLSQETRRLLDALAAPAQLDAAPVSDPEGL